MEGSSSRTLATALVALTTVALVTFALRAVNAAISNSEDNNECKSKKRKKRGKERKSNDAPQYVSGLVNVGNTCFMNSMVQALASVPSLRSYLEARKDLGHELDSVTLVLYETIEMLNIIHRRPTTKRLASLIKTMKSKASHVLTSQQQDAQELFQIISSQLSEERDKLDHPAASSLLDRMTVSEILNPPLATAVNGRQSVSSVVSASYAALPLSPSQQRSTPSSPIDDGRNDGAGDREMRNRAMMSVSLILDRSEQEKYHRAKSPFMGLLASRVSCVDCGYTHSCTLEDCLDAFIHLDMISDFNCRKCTLLKASKDLENKIELGKKDAHAKEIHERETNGQNEQPTDREQLAYSLETEAQEATEPGHVSAEGSRKARQWTTAATSNTRSAPLASRRVTLADLLQLKEQIDHCLQNNVEMDLDPIELTPVRSRRTTKHSMIAKPPQALCLHLNRSMITPSGQMAKNPCRVQFRSRLDFTPFTTSGHLTTIATKNISSRRSPIATPTASENESGDMFGLTSAGAGVGASSAFSRRASIVDRLALSTPATCSPPEVLTANTTGIKGAGTTLDMLESQSSRCKQEKLQETEDRVSYRLCAVVMHLGSHNSGHFVTYRRIPPIPPSSSLSSHSTRSSAPSMPDVKFRKDEDEDAHKSSWWRISDEDVQIVEWAIVRNSEAYMLFYEKES
ncbi:hypothetical protein BGX28_003211 [Mortierella sp. GBA30]|nr:hypothetical protein BGX28_003211 [Mortierella sp. GBA30]